MHFVAKAHGAFYMFLLTTVYQYESVGVLIRCEVGLVMMNVMSQYVVN